MKNRKHTENKKNRDLSERIPQKLAESAGIRPEAAGLYLKTDLTDEFRYGDVWLLVHDNTLYKYCEGHSIETYPLRSGDELAVEIAATTLAISLQSGGTLRIICRGSNALQRLR